MHHAPGSGRGKRSAAASDPSALAALAGPKSSSTYKQVRLRRFRIGRVASAGSREPRDGHFPQPLLGLLHLSQNQRNRSVSIVGEAHEPLQACGRTGCGTVKPDAWCSCAVSDDLHVSKPNPLGGSEQPSNGELRRQTGRPVLSRSATLITIGAFVGTEKLCLEAARKSCAQGLYPADLNRAKRYADRHACPRLWCVLK